ncbi:CG15347, partial [Drosophila busckii]
FTDSCVQCDSGSDVKCATDPINLPQLACANNSNTDRRCYSRVVNGFTLRGCVGELNNKTLASCNNEMECDTCGFDGCNRQIFPMHRAQCLQCSGNSSNSSCAIEVYAMSKACPIYKLGEKCYIRNSRRVANGSFQRGCLSSAHANKQCVKDGNCYTCEGRGCNFLQANDTLIPQARDSAVSVMLSAGLLLSTLLANSLL